MVKKYSIWVEDLPNGKYKFNQKYADPLRSTACVLHVSGGDPITGRR